MLNIDVLIPDVMVSDVSSVLVVSQYGIASVSTKGACKCHRVARYSFLVSRGRHHLRIYGRCMQKWGTISMHQICAKVRVSQNSPSLPHIYNINACSVYKKWTLCIQISRLDMPKKVPSNKRQNGNTHHCQFHVSASKEDAYQVEGNYLRTDLCIYIDSVITMYALDICSRILIMNPNFDRFIMNSFWRTINLADELFGQVHCK